MISAIRRKGSQSPPIIAAPARPSQRTIVERHSAGVRGGMGMAHCEFS
jgi:hypothetical protein